ncbi:SAM dependent methyltransferase [Legionella geestiana]|uniref:SAM dependent methyltransferase n=1 Tax=Legionella geestiana TaxID=45065 RepID=A0A0W0U387_9GAMM|nr:class I SAM-dependent methyltransferase [Legionella geestiana]KTD02376.1 SAM dependent methyltransferase [Legionella geestiana]QBS12150.1 class I SAM-dependent methyltransferase [Legionella geestiana]QDQ40136.1 class I SAM-dependent methyltransferase [Legionella geestiana]STX53122.1 SAM dependent methyltransferase [Legionella geestiana]
MKTLNNYQLYIDFYTSELGGTGYLAFRDLSKIISNHTTIHPDNIMALDFGCGAGRSSNLLRLHGYKVKGVDIDINMLNEARSHAYNGIDFHLMEKGKIPFEDNKFDIVFNSFVLLDIGSKNELTHNISEMHRVCKKNGLIISVTNSEHLFSKKWLTINNEFPENIDLKSGDIAKIHLTDKDIILFDYYWSHTDYVDCINRAGCSNVSVYQPLGNDLDGYQWFDEKIYPPYSIFVVKK